MQLSLTELTELHALMEHLSGIKNLKLGAITVHDSFDDPVGLLSEMNTGDWSFETIEVADGE